MARRDPDTDPRAFLGRELRRACVAAGFSSQDALAAKLGFDRTVITKGRDGGSHPDTRCLGGMVYDVRPRRGSVRAFCQAGSSYRRTHTRVVRGLARS